ncbi:ribosomal protein S6 kinase delta-1 isoform X2 [Ischnura elegans]|uniref:ribosomal protein S6 kinase delta-1 isoform X2 n=1 Tax=Ischnura elegans TaxID=197161 RepID=UPI001ED8B8E9|nr:ribosomal protein S6 kinase delta-1 isoform X2 [Ischnura elegans]
MLKNMAPKSDNWARKFSVTDPRRHSKGFTVYKVTSIVYPKLSPEAATKVVVWKRYNDFKKLHKELLIKHKKLHLKDKFPSFAKAKFFGRFEEEVVEERRQCAVRLLEFIAEHPPLFTSQVFLKFFETGYTVNDVGAPSDSHPSTLIAAASNDSLPIIRSPSSLSDGISQISTGEGDEGFSNSSRSYLKLGGTWQSPQLSDGVSLSSHSSAYDDELDDEECTTFTTEDTDSGPSEMSTPLHRADLAMFDPLYQNSYTDISNGKDDDRSVSDDKAVDGNQLISFDSQSLSSTGDDALFSSNAAQQKANYVLEAACHVSRALQSEANGEYDVAFASYKAGIATLLTGVQGDTDEKRRQIVKDKTAKYLLRAEKIFKEHLSSENDRPSRWSPLQMSPAKIQKTCRLSELRRPHFELKNFKVLGIIDKVMLVMDLENPAHCFVMKVLHKSSCPVNNTKPTSIPQNVPYMVKLYKYFETDNSVLLVLQHAGGGKLWDHISSYFQSAQKTPIKGMGKNAYMGQKLIDSNSSSKNTETGNESGTNMISKQCQPISRFPASVVHEIATALESGDSNSDIDESYMELIRDYTSLAVKDFQRGPCLNKIPPRISPTGPLDDGPRKNGDTQIRMNFSQKLSNSNVKPEISYCAKEATSATNVNSETLTVGKCVQIGQSNGYVSNLVSRYIPDPTVSWRNLENLQTTDLVQNAQKLLESVNETLQKSEKVTATIDVTGASTGVVDNVSGLLKSDSNQNIKVDEQASDALDLSAAVGGNVCDNDVELRSAPASSEKSRPLAIVKCKSVDSSTFVSASRKVRERRNSWGRRKASLSRTRLERRYSCGDIFEGRMKTASSSLELGGTNVGISMRSRFFQSSGNSQRPKLPESLSRAWASELLVALEALHESDIVCMDLRPDNILLGDNGHIILTFMCHWHGVDVLVDSSAAECLYAAPEVNSIFGCSASADWWSFGAIIFELLTGKTLLSCHPGGIHSHSILNIPEFISPEAKSLLTELLRPDPLERLGSGINGIENLKAHPFFQGVDWQAVKSAGLLSSSSS